VTDGSVWIPLLSAFIGAIAAGLLQTIIAVCDRKKKSEAVLTALSSEVDSICRLIRYRGYLEDVDRELANIESVDISQLQIIIDIRSNYFSVYEGSVHELGFLKPEQSAKITKFYAYCKSFIDTCRPDGPRLSIKNLDEAKLFLQSEKSLLEAILFLGDTIIQMPKLEISDNAN